MGPQGPFPHGNVHGIYVTFHSYRKEVFMCWVWLFLAISLEVAATVFMKLSEGFSRVVPTAIMGVLYAVSFVPLAIALKKMDVGVAYAVWSAVGTAMVTLVGVFLFKESVSALKVVSIALIIAGVVSLNLSSRVIDKRPLETTASSDSIPPSNTVAMTSEPNDAARSVSSQR
jgi:small multidrug resistance pump